MIRTCADLEDIGRLARPTRPHGPCSFHSVATRIIITWLDYKLLITATAAGAAAVPELFYSSFTVIISACSVHDRWISMCGWCMVMRHHPTRLKLHIIFFHSAYCLPFVLAVHHASSLLSKPPPHAYTVSFFLHKIVCVTARLRTHHSKLQSHKCAR